MPHVSSPAYCLNPDCRAPLSRYEHVNTHTTIGGLRPYSCAACGTLLALLPAIDFSQLEEKISRLR
jgi:hypothetical protein